MQAKKKVLIAEDSPTIRILLQKIINSHDDFEVVGVASNGKEAVEKTVALRPDVITMDIRMPVMDGFEATRQIMAKNPVPILVVSASVNSDDLKITFQAIKAGALDIIEKPKGVINDLTSIDHRIIQKLRVISDVKVIHRSNSVSRSTAQTVVRPGLKQQKVPYDNNHNIGVVAIAASTGGPAALLRVLTGLTADFPAPITIVQHITQGFGNGFVTWLDNELDIPVKLAKHDQAMQNGVVYVAPDNRHLRISKYKRLLLDDSNPVGGLKPYANYLFESIAAAFGRNALAIVLTGMGKDGGQGLKSLHDKGALTIAQDKESSVVFGMPMEAIELGAAKHVLSLAAINEFLVKLPFQVRE
jgi:two-component system chemotaxis response regulator CheB